MFHASPKLAAVGSVDEAVVIGAALSLSSSAFVLQLLSERGELATKFGSATLGILLLQARAAAAEHWCSLIFKLFNLQNTWANAPAKQMAVTHS